MHTLVLALAALALNADPGAKPKAPRVVRENGCPFVGTADIDNKGEVQNVVGNELPPGGQSADAFDVDGPVGKLRVTGSGDLRLQGGVPAKVKNSTFTHVLVTDVKSLRVAQPEKDLPQGVFPDAVQILLADHGGAKVVLLSIPGSVGSDECSEIQAKTKAGWKRCWSDCRQ